VVCWAGNFFTPKRGKTDLAGNWQRNFKLAIFGRINPAAIAANVSLAIRAARDKAH